MDAKTTQVVYTQHGQMAAALWIDIHCKTVLVSTNSGLYWSILQHQNIRLEMQSSDILLEQEYKF